MGFIDDIKARAKTSKKTIVLPETEDIRTYEAAEAVLKEGTANLILVGSEEEIAKNKGSFDISGATIVDPAKSEKTDAYIAKLVELREKKGMTEEKARELLLTNYLYYGVMMVKMKDADGMVSGACHSTADTLRPSLQILKTKPGTKLVSALSWSYRIVRWVPTEHSCLVIPDLSRIRIRRNLQQSHFHPQTPLDF